MTDSSREQQLVPHQNRTRLPPPTERHTQKVVCTRERANSSGVRPARTNSYPESGIVSTTPGQLHRLYDTNEFFPVLEPPFEPNQNGAIPILEQDLLTAAFEDRDLIAKDRIFQSELLLRLQKGSNEGKKNAEKHRRKMIPLRSAVKSTNQKCVEISGRSLFSGGTPKFQFSQSRRKNRFCN